jgi:hypothetical protein
MKHSCKETKEWLKNNNATFGMLIFVAIIMLFVNLVFAYEFKTTQTQVSELKILVDQMLIQAMISDTK